jgi:AraC family transcriptional regulator
MKNTISKPQLNEYTARVNKVIDYIERQIDKNFTLEELASVANFSKFHFNRIFQAMIGETPFRFIQRIRIEKAAMQLVTLPHIPVSVIALQCGFPDPAVFSRVFRDYFGKPASEYRKMQYSENRNLSQPSRNPSQERFHTSLYFCSETKSIKWRTNMEQMKKVEVMTLPKKTLAYIRYIGAYQGNEGLFGDLWGKLCGWAGPRGLLGLPETEFIVVYHDDPNITEPDKLRMSVSVTVPPDTKVDGEVGKMELDGGRYMVALFEVNATEFSAAWEWVYGSWLPASGYQPDDGPCFERYVEEPANGMFKVEICVPVKPL